MPNMQNLIFKKCDKIIADTLVFTKKHKMCAIYYIYTVFHKKRPLFVFLKSLK